MRDDSSTLYLSVTSADGRNRRGSVASLGPPHSQNVNASGASETCPLEHPNGNTRQTFTPSDLLMLNHHVQLPSLPEPIPFDFGLGTITSNSASQASPPELSHGAGSSCLPSLPSLQPNSRSASINTIQELPQLYSIPQSQALDRIQSLPPSRASTIVLPSSASSSTWNSPSMFSTSMSKRTSITEATVNSDSRRSSLDSLNPLSADMILGNLKGVVMYAWHPLPSSSPY